ncbi:MAG: hypothetical protein WAW41_07925 [Methylobacter sp.]
MAIIINNLSVSAVSSDAELYAIWPTVREGIGGIKRRSEGMFYMPEDVYHEIKLKQATLLIGRDVITEDYEGFVIIKDYQYPDGKGLFIWIMHHDGKCDDFVPNFMAALMLMGDAVGVIRYCTSAARKGWDRWATRKGFIKTGTINHYEFTR